jgi:hypothetical protein
MKFVRCFAIVLPIVLAAAGCERRESTRIVDPPPEPRPEVVEAHWVTDKDALDGAVRDAAASPLVQLAVRSSTHPRLTPLHHLAVRAVGRLNSGMRVGVTILPYMVDNDSTHATFVSLIEGDGARIADVGELIVGRAPTSLETDFRPVDLGGKIGWMKGVSAYAGSGDGKLQRSPEKRRWAKFIECVLEGAFAACSAGADLADDIAPGVPRARAIGCGIGVAGLVLGCAIQHLVS